MKREELKQYFQATGPSEMQKVRMLAGVLEQYEAQCSDACVFKGDMNMNMNVKKRISRLTVIAAVMALTAVSAFAAVPELRNWVGVQFGLTAEQEQALSQSGTLQNVETAATDGLRTLTVRQTLSDENSMYIVYDVDTVDGSKVTVDEDGVQFQASDADGVFIYSMEHRVLEERQSGVTCMAVLTGLEDLSGQQVSLTSCGVTCEWTMGTVAPMEAYEADIWGKDVWTGRDYHVTGCSMSPICVKLDLEACESLKNAGMPNQVTIDVLQADGTVKQVAAGSSTAKEENGDCWQMFLLDEIIEVDAVQAVYVDGVKLN